MIVLDSDIQRVSADPHFPALKHFIISSTGLSYYQDKDRELAAAIVRAAGPRWNSAAVYLTELSAPESEALERLTEELTIGETFFFRHREMFAALREHVFPALHRHKAAEKKLRIWSAGCSIGAEPYSLSILLRSELAHLFHEWRIEIIATDINRRFLRLAREAIFERWALRGLPDSERDRCFEPAGKKWRLQSRFVHDVTFQHHNLVSDRFPSLASNLFAFDLIICRNVMIYFDTQTIQRLAGQFQQSLVPGGWLAVGHAEPHTEIFREFETVNTPGAVLYHRRTSDSVAHSPFQPRAPLSSPVRVEPASLPAPEPIPRFELPPLQHLAFTSPRTEPSNLDALRALADEGDFASALASCRRLLAAEPLNAELHFFHGLLLEQTSAPAPAREAFQRSIYLDRHFALAHYHLGTLCENLADHDDARRAFRNAWQLIEHEPDDAPVRHGDGMTAADLKGLIEHHLSFAW